MVRVEHRFVKRQVRRRGRRDGTVWAREYFYYRRPGAPDDGKRLPDDPTGPEFADALRLFNARAAEDRPAEQIAGSFAHLVWAYRASSEFTTLAPMSTAETNGRVAAEQNRRAERSGPGLPGCCAAQLGGGLTGVREERWRFLLCARR